MGLSNTSVKKAYEVFSEIRKSVLPELVIPSFPNDMQLMSDIEKENPQLNHVYGFDRKSDGSWENIFFFVKNPSDELIEKFEQLKNKVPNSSMNHAYSRNKKLWRIGWF